MDKKIIAILSKLFCLTGPMHLLTIFKIVWLDLGPNCLQKSLADQKKSRLASNNLNRSLTGHTCYAVSSDHILFSRNDQSGRSQNS